MNNCGYPYSEAIQILYIRLKKADPEVIISPFQASKQHYSSLSTL